MRFLSKILFYLSSFSVLPPRRALQDTILQRVSQQNDYDSFLKRSLQQYECHTHYFLPVIWFSFQVFSIFAILPLILVVAVRNLKKTAVKKISDIVLVSKVPSDIQQKMHLGYVKKPIGYLKLRDLKFAMKILFKSGFRPYFVFRSLWKLAIYSELMDIYQPKRIWVTQEMVFESSLLTNYLNCFGVRHINFMHGVNFFSIQVAFSSFHEFYIWDEYYIKLFKSLCVETEKYEIFSALDRPEGQLPQKNILKYYSQYSERKKDFEKILDNLIQFSKDKNCLLSVRLHPLHKKQFEIDALSERGISIEPNSIDLTDSLCEARYVCSEFSGVLYHASLLNREIIIDNSFPERIERLKELDIIFFDKLPHEYLVTSAEKSHKSSV